MNAAQGGRSAHIAHVAMIAFHTLCCGLPIIALALSSASSGMLAFQGWANGLHGALHAREALILATSGALVVIGGMLEWRARCKRDGYSWLFGLSLAAFTFNLILFGVHHWAGVFANI